MSFLYFLLSFINIENVNKYNKNNISNINSCIKYIQHVLMVLNIHFFSKTKAKTLTVPANSDTVTKAINLITFFGGRYN